MPETVTFDHYEVLTRDDGSLHELGRGAMGITYKAFDTNLRIPVALKVINATFLNSEVARQRFIREARSAAKLRHRNVASVFHLGIESDAYFYAMEFIDGETVDALIKRQGALNPFVALQIASQVARALNAAQPHGLVHRDIKPANLMLVREDEELAVKVIDFGLAKSSLPGESDEESGSSSMGGFVGTPHFASPEQLDEKEIDVRSDIYSLGVTLWYMLAGQTPFAGSMAQIMSQHLSKAPPFERLAGVPAPLSALLGRMLEKDPSRRPQTPAELRREIDECIEKLKASVPANSAPIDAAPNLATIIGSPADGEKAGALFETGAMVAARYHILRDLGETNTGHLFHARQLAPERAVRLLVLNRELVEETATYTQIEREVGRVMAAAHANLLQIHGIETVERDSFIVSEWTNGFSLLELLRTRRELRATEVLALLPQAAGGIDHATRAGLRRLDVELHQVFVDFGDGPVTKEELLRQPVEAWPPFSLKLNPLGITRELSASETWAGRQTIVGGLSPSAAQDENAPSRYIQALAAIVYELLGGTLTPFALKVGGTHRYTPIATLSEQGNNVLRRALDPRTNFATAHDFYSALSGVDGLEVERHDTKTVSPTEESTPRREARPVTLPPPPVARRQVRPVTAAQPARRQKMPVKFVGGLVTVGVLAAAIYFFGIPAGEKKRDERGGAESTSPRKRNEELTVTPDPVVPTPPVPPAPPAAPSREELLKVATAEADALEAKKDWPGSIEKWMEIARDYPEGMGKVRLEMLFEHLRTDPEEVSARDLSRVQELAVQVAPLDVLTAMTFLGKSLREKDPAGSLSWYSAAATQGDVGALVQLGLLLSNTHELPKAFACFQGASEQGSLPAKYLLAECYLNGKGVEKDEKHAVELLREAADKQYTWAMDLLGVCYRKGVGVEKNFNEAVRLFTAASKLGNGRATANLGVLSMNGEGVPKDPRMAAGIFRDGIAAGDPTGTCMYFYAQCFETGSGVPPNYRNAVDLYTKAAEMGNDAANAWCRQKKLNVTPKKPARGSTPFD